jgi:hypothetical protein
MQRRVEVTVPPERTDELLTEIRKVDGILGLRVERGVSEHPKGDLVSVETLTRAHIELMALLESRGIARDSSSSISVTETKAVISPTVEKNLGREASTSSWEQMEAEIAKESNMTGNAMLIMGISGAIAAAGLITGALHIVVAAMVIAPGFEPIIRIPLGLANGSRAWQRGLKDLLLGYASLIAGAALLCIVAYPSYEPILSGGSAYHTVESLVSYWTTWTLTGMAIAVVGGMAGALLVAANRAVLTVGVLIALVLIPSAAMVGVALVAGDLSLAGRAFLRWATEVGIVFISSGLVWVWQRTRVQRRPSML